MEDELRPEYSFDYSKAKPNRFAERTASTKAMSFRNSAKTDADWRAWVRKHEDELVAAGVPRETFADRLRWFSFLAHTGLDESSRWSVEMLDARHAGRLRVFLEREYPEDQDCHWLIQQLKRLEDRGRGGP